MVNLKIIFPAVFAVISISVQAACLFNSSHCQCAEGHSTGLCLRRETFESSAMTCLVDTCKNAYKCDCMGSAVCPLEQCTKFKLSAAPSMSPSVDIGAKVQCVSESGVCVGSPTDDVATPCVHNSTHCQCASGHGGGHCLRFVSGSSSSATCIVEECSSGGYKCDCMGESLCKLHPCGRWTTSADMSQVLVGTTVTCSYLDSLSGMSGRCAVLTQ